MKQLILVCLLATSAFLRAHAMVDENATSTTTTTTTTVGPETRDPNLPGELCTWPSKTLSGPVGALLPFEQYLITDCAIKEDVSLAPTYGDTPFSIRITRGSTLAGHPLAVTFAGAAPTTFEMTRTALASAVRFYGVAQPGSVISFTSVRGTIVVTPERSSIFDFSSSSIWGSAVSIKNAVITVHVADNELPTSIAAITLPAAQYHDVVNSTEVVFINNTFINSNFTVESNQITFTGSNTGDNCVLYATDLEAGDSVIDFIKNKITFFASILGRRVGVFNKILPFINTTTVVDDVTTVTYNRDKTHRLNVFDNTFERTGYPLDADIPTRGSVFFGRNVVTNPEAIVMDINLRYPAVHVALNTFTSTASYVVINMNFREERGEGQRFYFDNNIIESSDLTYTAPINITLDESFKVSPLALVSISKNTVKSRTGNKRIHKFIELNWDEANPNLIDERIPTVVYAVNNMFLNEPLTTVNAINKFLYIHEAHAEIYMIDFQAATTRSASFTLELPVTLTKQIPATLTRELTPPITEAPTESEGPTTPAPPATTTLHSFISASSSLSVVIPTAIVSAIVAMIVA